MNSFTDKKIEEFCVELVNKHMDEDFKTFDAKGLVNEVLEIADTAGRKQLQHLKKKQTK